MAYATADFYRKHYLLGREAQLPPEEFSFWAARAAEHIDRLTFNRINMAALKQHKAAIATCTCELAEFLCRNEGSENKASESIQGRSVSYRQGTEYEICQRHLWMTGLLYRGSGYAAEGRGKNNNHGL